MICSLLGLSHRLIFTTEISPRCRYKKMTGQCCFVYTVRSVKKQTALRTASSLYQLHVFFNCLFLCHSIVCSFIIPRFSIPFGHRNLSIYRKTLPFLHERVHHVIKVSILVGSCRKSTRVLVCFELFDTPPGNKEISNIRKQQHFYASIISTIKEW